jgi:ATP-binding cassette, subfamily B, multidrug efflux pump
MSENNEKKVRATKKQQTGAAHHGPPGSAIGRPVEKAKDFKGTIKRLAFYMKSQVPRLVIVLIFAVVSTIFTINAPKIMGNVTNDLTDGFIAKSTVNSVSKGQKQIIDQMRKQYNNGITSSKKSAYATAKQKVDAIVTQKFNEVIAKQKQKAYTMAGQKANEIVTQKFNAAITTKKQQAYATATQKVDAIVTQKFNAAIAAKKQQAYATAMQKVDAIVTQKFNAAITAKKQQAYATAKQQADTIATQKFNEAIEVQKQQAYKEANEKADAAAKESVDSKYKAANPNVSDLTTIPGYNDTLAAAQKQAEAQAKTEVDAAFANKQPQIDAQFSAAKKEAEAMAKKAVDAGFAKQQPQINAKLAAAKKQGEAQAKKAVDAGFAKQQPQINAKLAAAKKQGEAQAKKAVDAGFAKQQATINAQLATAKVKAEAAARSAVDKAFAKQQPELNKKLTEAKSKGEKTAISKVNDALNKASFDELLRAFKTHSETTVSKNFEKTMAKKMKLNASQVDAFEQLLVLPDVKTLKSNEQKADTVKKMLELKNKLPNSLVKKGNTVSKTDEDKGIADVRKYGGAIPFKQIAQTLLFLLVIYALSALFQFFMQFVMSGVAQKTVFELRKAVDNKINKMPLRYFDSHPNGDTLSRVTNDIDTISTTLQQSLTQLISSALLIIGYVYMMLTISGVMTLIVLATLPLYILVTVLIAKRSQSYFTAQQKHLGELSGHTEEMFTGHVIVKAFGHEPDSIEVFKGINDDLYDVGWKAQFMSGIMMPLMNFIGNVGYVMIAVVGGIFVTKSLLNLGDIVSFISYSKSFTMPIIQTANIANIIQSTVACAERVFELLDETEEIPEAADSVQISEPEGNIRFNHVAFSYNEDEPLMKDMDLNIRQGETIAIVGPTGAGKTTLVNLLMRFYEIQGGSITFDGTDVKKLRRGDLRKMFGMVLQDTWLFNGTIHDNIAYGRENATEEDIINAAKAAHADHFIRSLPDGYNTVLNEEASNISQGQKQLLTIARAILADPAVLILDEATSSVDTRTEVLIQKAMGKLMQGRTNFVIAHRLSTIRDAKMILVMNHGTIIEQGNHNELLEKGGFYADLYNSQFTGASLA